MADCRTSLRMPRGDQAGVPYIDIPAKAEMRCMCSEECADELIERLACRPVVKMVPKVSARSARFRKIGKQARIVYVYCDGYLTSDEVRNINHFATATKQGETR